MSTALDIAEAVVTAASQSFVRGGQSYCQQFAGAFWERAKGRATPNSYGNARAAYQASTIESMDPATAPPGAYHYFRYASDDHVGPALGDGLMASATGWATKALRSLGQGVYVHRVADYATHLTYLGWSYTNGAREQITGLDRIGTTTLAGLGVTPIEGEDDMYEDDDRKRDAEILALLKEQQKRNLSAKVSDETGTLAQTTRDARIIARRTEIAVQALAATVAAGEGLTTEQLTGIIDTAVEKAVTDHMPSADDIAAALAEVVPDADPAALAAAVAPLLTVTVAG